MDNIVNELAFDDKFGSEVFEPTDFFRIYYYRGFDVWGDIFKIVLVLAPVPDPVSGKRPGIYFEEEGIEIWHNDVSEYVAIYICCSGKSS